MPRVTTEWCIEGVAALDEETCYVLPEARTDSLLLYLHGIVPPEKTSVQKTNLETVVANASRRAGVSALIPRGKQGLAPKGHEKWWGWPTATPTYRRHGPELIAKLLEKRKLFEQRTGTRFSRVYVAGSSSGAYFAAALALHGGIEADGFAILSGGAWRDTPELAKLAPKPVYIGFGKHDSVGAGARGLADLFRRAGWPVKVAEHPVPHGAREIYLDEAFAFFEHGSKK
jgi:predicted esterase